MKGVTKFVPVSGHTYPLFLFEPATSTFFACIPEGLEAPDRLYIEPLVTSSATPQELIGNPIFKRRTNLGVYIKFNRGW